MLTALKNRVAGWLLANRTPAAEPVQTAGSGTARAHDTDPAAMLGNPLRNLTPINAASIFEAALRGEWTRAQWLMFWVEQFDADVITLVERRCGGPKRLAWDIRTDATAKKRGLEKLADEQAEFLRGEYAKIDNLREALEHLGTARFRGFAHVRIDNGGTHLECLDQWWWLRDGMFGDWYWNPRALATAWDSLGESAKIDPADYLIRVETRNLLFLSLAKFLRANWSEKWWDRLIEICARRGIVVVGPPILPPTEKAEFQAAAKAIGVGESGWLQNGVTIEHTGMDLTTGVLPFEARLEWLSRRLILAGTGGMLTALNAPTGLGGSQGEEQGNVWRALLQQDGGDLSELFQAQFDKPRLAERFPGREVLAWFELQTADDPTPKAVLEEAKLASEAGYQMDLEQLEEKTGYTLTLKPAPAPALPPGGSDPSDMSDTSDMSDAERAEMMANRRALAKRLALANRTALPAERIAESATRELLAGRGLEDWFAPVAVAVEAALRGIPDGMTEDGKAATVDAATFRTRLERLLAQIPDLLSEVGNDGGAFADQLAAACMEAYAAGAERGPGK